MGKNNRHGQGDLAPTGARLTPKQERFAQLVASGSNYSDAYRQAYDAENMSPEAVKVEASSLMDHPTVSLTVKELRDAVQAQMTVSREKIIEELGKVAFADVPTEAVRASDKVNALDKISKVAGFYREDQREPRHPIQVTHVTVMLDHGDGRKTTEDWDVQAPVVPGVIDGESHVLPEDEADSEENHD